MRQIGAENDDPLKRIQAEINEVEQREREHRAKLATVAAKMMDANDSDFADDVGIDTRQSIMSPISDGHSSLSSTPDKDPCSDSVSAFSDDSGISSASSPINGQSADDIIKSTPISNGKITTSKYIRLNTVQNAITASPLKTKTTAMSGVASKIMTRTTSTPHIFVPGMTPRFQINPAKKGLMQRFIATRGKMAAASIAAAAISNNANEEIKNENNNVNGKSNSFASKRANTSILTSLELNRPPLFMMNSEVTSPPVIERDAQGKPIRRGFIPVEEKIQKELRDMRSRETELKRIRRESFLRQSQPDLLDCFEQDVAFDSTGEDSDEEHCFMPNKMRSSKSISELCDALSSNTSLTPRETPSPQSHREFSRCGMKPALSLAQLCDVDPNEAPSSHRLIAQWENIIQRNQ